MCLLLRLVLISGLAGLSTPNSFTFNFHITMCVANKLTATACGRNAAGLSGTGYMSPAGEFASWPSFTAAVTAGDGNTVVLSGNFSFTGAGSGKGYFRSFPMLLEKGAVVKRAVGGRGSKSIETTATFYITGADKVQLEWLRDQLNIPGVWLITDKNGTVHVLGSKEDPAYLEEAEMNTGTAATDERGTLYTIRSITSDPAIYTGTINLTPIP